MTYRDDGAALGLRREEELRAQPFDVVSLTLSPCPVSWADMVGGARVRRCGLCNKDVYAVEELTVGEVGDLLGRPGGACLQLRRRPDGTVVTKDCPTGRRGVVRLAVLAAPVAVLAALPAVWPAQPVPVLTEPAAAPAPRAPREEREGGRSFQVAERPTRLYDEHSARLELPRRPPRPRPTEATLLTEPVMPLGAVSFRE